MAKMVIGLVGPIASGKGTVASYLGSKGFLYTSLSDRIREEAGKRGVSREDRRVLQDLGDALRKNFGSGALAEITAKKYKSEHKLVIDSIRHPEEIRLLRKELKAVIIGVTAPRRKRFGLLKKRKRKGDPNKWEDFVKKDKREFSKKAKDHQIQVGKCLEMADYVIANTGNEEELLAKVKKKVGEIFSK